ncbi:MAG: sel1 repeat family protein [Thiobacillus sp.]|nr:sel1 repeat family protein [Thiobacillus sp.]
MKRTLLITAFAFLLPVSALAEPVAAPDANKAAYDKALQAYSCVDYDKAYRLFLENAKTGFSQSEYMVGVMLSAGQGHDQDHKGAFDWFASAAQKGLADAQYALGDVYQKGEGVAKDPVQALFWYELAYQGGYKLAKESVDSIVKALPADQVETVLKQVADWQAKQKR